MSFLLALLQLVIPAPLDTPPPPATGLSMRACPDCRTPRDAIELAAAVAPATPPSGSYRITVRAVGQDGGRFYINSERDYRDQRNVSLAFDAVQARRLVAAMGGRSVEDALVGRDLIVVGSPKRVHISFLSKGRPTGLYYYQTHIVVTDVSRQLYIPER